MSNSGTGLLRKKNALKVYLEMIKIEHSVFALPFAMIGMLYAANGFPGWRVFLLIIVAMVSARSSAMAFNRIVDRHIDAKNPRTANRAIPSGILRLDHTFLFLLVSVLVFFVSAGMLNTLTLMLSPIALFVITFYSYTKRWTWLCHMILGFSLGIAPVGAWIGVTGTFELIPLWWTGAVMFWTAGFDILYSLQDVDFDRANNLKSIPERFGVDNAILISRIFHVMSLCCLVVAGAAVSAGIVYFIGCFVVACLLVYEQSLVKPNDLSKLDMAFFTMNGFISIGLFCFVLLDIILNQT